MDAKSLPHWEFFSGRFRGHFIRDFFGSSETVCAILGATLIDDGIEKLLKKNLIHFNKSLFNFINGPLGTAGARIDMAHALGFFGNEAASDLRSVNTIRNKFAHEMFMEASDATIQPTSFRSNKIAAICRSLKWPDKYLARGHPKTTKPRLRFMNAVLIFATVILNAIHDDMLIFVPGVQCPCLVEYYLKPTALTLQRTEQERTQPDVTQTTVHSIHPGCSEERKSSSSEHDPDQTTTDNQDRREPPSDESNVVD